MEAKYQFVARVDTATAEALDHLAQSLHGLHRKVPPRVLAESEPTGRVCPGCGTRGDRIERGLVWNAVHRGECPDLRAFNAAERREREAPLVALVNSPPGWADPNAWRAAVLAVAERSPLRSSVHPYAAGEIRLWLERGLAGHHLWEGSSGEIALNAYRRAMTPAAKVAPERKTRGPVLVCDAGWEDE